MRRHFETEPLVKARGLTKFFGTHKAVDNIGFDIHPGELVGFLGPNGAGKTTTIRMMLNLLNPTLGELTLFGLDFKSSRAQILQQMIGSSGTITLPGKLSVLETLKVFGDLYSIHQADRRIEELIEKFDLKGLRKNSLYSLSRGQQVRVSLAKSFLNHPKLLLLDEPTSNLDPEVADRVRSHLTETVKSEGTTVFLTSHNMREVEAVCSRVLFLNHGKIQAEGTPKELAKQVKRWKVTLKTSPPIRQLKDFTPPSDSEITIEDGIFRIKMNKDKVGEFLTDIVKKGAVIETISVEEPTLEDFFLHSTRISK